MAVLVVLVWTAVATFIILQVVKLVVGLRVDEQQETQGLDITQHEETGYNM
jgi:Amt family ammonium transporter